MAYAACPARSTDGALTLAPARPPAQPGVMDTTPPADRGAPPAKGRPGSPRVRLSSPADVLAAVPPLFGFHPAKSLVVLGAGGRRDRLRLGFRYDLPDPPDAEAARQITEHAVTVLARRRATSVIAVGYGPGRLVTPLLDLLATAAGASGLAVRELLRVEDSRYWSYLCRDVSCCPAEGVPFDPRSHPVAAVMSAAGVPPGGHARRAGGRPGRQPAAPGDRGRAARRPGRDRPLPRRRCDHRRRPARLARGELGSPAGPRRRVGADGPRAPRRAPAAVDRPGAQRGRPMGARPSGAARVHRLAVRGRGAGQRRDRPRAGLRPGVLDGAAAAGDPRRRCAAIGGAAADEPGRGRAQLRAAGRCGVGADAAGPERPPVRGSPPARRWRGLNPGGGGICSRRTDDRHAVPPSEP